MFDLNTVPKRYFELKVPGSNKVLHIQPPKLKMLVKMGITELFCLLFILYEATSVLKNMLLCGIPVPAGIREKLTVWLDSMTDETQVDMEYETGEHSEVSLTLDLEELEHLTLPQLHALAKEMGVEYTDSTTVEELAALLVEKHITAVI